MAETPSDIEAALKAWRSANPIDADKISRGVAAAEEKAALNAIPAKELRRVAQIEGVPLRARATKTEIAAGLKAQGAALATRENFTAKEGTEVYLRREEPKPEAQAEIAPEAAPMMDENRIQQLVEERINAMLPELEERIRADLKISAVPNQMTPEPAPIAQPNAILGSTVPGLSIQTVARPDNFYGNTTLTATINESALAPEAPEKGAPQEAPAEVELSPDPSTDTVAPETEQPAEEPFVPSSEDAATDKEVLAAAVGDSTTERTEAAEIPVTLQPEPAPEAPEDHPEVVAPVVEESTVPRTTSPETVSAQTPELRAGQQFVNKFNQRFEIVDVTGDSPAKVLYRDRSAEVQGPPTPLEVSEFAKYVRQGIFTLEQTAEKPVAAESAPEPAAPVALEPDPGATQDEKLAAAWEARVNPPSIPAGDAIDAKLAEAWEARAKAQPISKVVATGKRSEKTGFYPSALNPTSWFGARAFASNENVSEIKNTDDHVAALERGVKHHQETIAKRREVWAARKEKFRSFTQRLELVGKQLTITLALVANLLTNPPQRGPEPPAPIVAEAPIPPPMPQPPVAPPVQQETAPSAVSPITFPSSILVTPRGYWGTYEDILKNTSIPGITQMYQRDYIADGLTNAYLQHLKDIGQPVINETKVPAGTTIDLDYFNHHPEIVSNLVERARNLTPEEVRSLIRVRMKNEAAAR